MQIWCSDRRGGVSRAPFDSCNVGDHVGDDPEAVTRNRGLVAATAGLPGPAAWQWMDQVHGNCVVEAAAAPRDRPTADAAVTASPTLPVAVVTADCAPIV
ncbi:MAG: laccase domain-containing protein, partial [Acidimicrobiia bacterium]